MPRRADLSQRSIRECPSNSGHPVNLAILDAVAGQRFRFSEPLRIRGRHGSRAVEIF